MQGRAQEAGSTNVRGGSLHACLLLSAAWFAGLTGSLPAQVGGHRHIATRSPAPERCPRASSRP